MKKPLILTNILALFLSSCSSITSMPPERIPAASTQSCQDILKNIQGANISPEKKIADLKALLKVDVNEQEISDLLKTIDNKNLSQEEADTLKAIILFSREDDPTRKELLSEFSHQLNGNHVDENNKTWKKFSYHKEKVENKKKVFKTLEEASSFEKLYYSCKVQVRSTPTQAQLQQAKKLTYALTIGSLGSSIATYSAVHWEEEKNKKWFSELSFSLAITGALSFFGGKAILSNPRLNPWKSKMPLSYLTNAVTDAGISGIYAFTFQTNDAELEKKLKELQADPEAQKRLEELLVIAEENHLFEKHLKNTQNLFIDKKTKLPMKSSDFEGEATFDNVDLDASRELLMAALAEQEYIEKSGVLATGNPALDRYSFHRIYNLMSAPTNIGLTILMSNQLCMNQDPKKGFTRAVALYMGVSILMDAIYFKGKKDLINQ